MSDCKHPNAFENKVGCMTCPDCDVVFKRGAYASVREAVALFDLTVERDELKVRVAELEELCVEPCPEGNEYTNALIAGRALCCTVRAALDTKQDTDYSIEDKATADCIHNNTDTYSTRYCIDCGKVWPPEVGALITGTDSVTHYLPPRKPKQDSALHDHSISGAITRRSEKQDSAGDGEVDNVIV